MKILGGILVAFALSASIGCSSEPAAASSDNETADDNEIRAAESENSAPVGRRAHAALRELAPKVTLGFLGEDSGSMCTASFRRGPAAGLSAEETLRLFQFNVEAQMASPDFSFEKQDRNDESFWQTFEETQWDDEGAAAARDVKALFTGPDVTDLAIMIPADREAFSASVFLVASITDGSLLVLRGQVGGMSF